MKSGNYVSVPTSLEKATILFESVYADLGNYEIINFETNLDKMSSELKPMEASIISAIEYIMNHTFDFYEYQENVSNQLMERYGKKEFLISEKETYILWGIFFRNREIIENNKLMSLAHQYFIY